MRRREFIPFVGSAVAAWPLVARTQQAGKLLTIGILSATTPSATASWITALERRLRELGWINGRTIVIKYRWAGNSDAVVQGLSTQA
jgi:putative tryptophan/tyrosine transport system substrate-binding protein